MKINIVLEKKEKDFTPHMMFDPNSDDKKKAEKAEDHEEMGEKGCTHVDPEELRKVLKDEGGASGMDPFIKAIPDSDEEEIKKTLDAMEDVGQHEDGDYILDDDKEIIVNIIKKKKQFVLEKRKKRKKKKKKKSSGKKDACYHKVKSRYKVWPSAYASGALVRCRKVGAKNWGNKSKKKK